MAALALQDMGKTPWQAINSGRAGMNEENIQQTKIIGYKMWNDLYSPTHYNVSC